jgi:hypothetical protein
MGVYDMNDRYDTRIHRLTYCRLNIYSMRDNTIQAVQQVP